MQTASVSASAVPAFPPALDQAPSARRQRSVNLTERRYTVNLTERQQDAIITECDRRGCGISEFIRRIIDGWVENRLKRDGGA